MTPGQQLQRILADVPGYDATDVAALLPFAAALQSALLARMIALQKQPLLPDTDYLLNTDQIAERLGKTTRWVRDNLSSLPFARQVGREYRFSARGLDDWISRHPGSRISAALPLKGRHHER